MSIAAKNISFNLAGLTVYRQRLFYVYYPPHFRQIVLLSLEFYRSRRLPRAVIEHTVHAAHFVDDARGHARE